MAIRMYILAALLVFSLAQSVLAASEKASDYDLLGGNGFDTWQLPDGTSVEFEDDAQVLTVSSDTPKALFAVGAGLADGAAVKTLRITGEIRVKDGKQGANSWDKPRIHFTFHDRLGNQIGGWPDIGMWTGTFGWKKINGNLKVPSEAKSFRIYAGLHDTSGTISFRNIMIQGIGSDGKPVKPAVANDRNDTSNWYPWAYDDNTGFAGNTTYSPINVSYLLDKPAGKHGFVTVKGGRLTFADGTPARFLGVNLVAQTCFPTREDAKALAIRLARYGVNMVRLHHMDAFWAQPNIFGNAFDTTELDPYYLDCLDYLIYQLKLNGIYVFMDLLVNRQFSESEGVAVAGSVEAGGKVVGQYDSRIIELQKDYAKKLLTHLNPYTGKKYVDEPAIALLDIINESSLFWKEPVSDYYRKELQNFWNKWLVREYGDRAALEKAWGAGSLNPGEDPAKGTVLLSNLGTGKRRGDYNIFLYDTQTGYYLEMRSYLRSLGLRIPVTGSNHWQREVADVASNAALDFIDNHGYWDHPQGGYGTEVTFTNAPMVAGLGNLVSGLATKRVIGKPYTVTEWQCSWPNEYKLEGMPIVVSYAMLQGWDALLQFDFAGTDWQPQISGNFDTGNKPDIFAQWPALALVFHKGYIAEGSGLTAKAATKMIASGAAVDALIPSYAPLVDKVGIELWRDTPKSLTKADVDGYLSSTGKAAVSRTKQLAWDAAAGIFSLDTPKAQGAVGFIGGSPKQLTNTRFDIHTEFASILTVVLDGLDLRESTHILLTAVARSENEGTVYNSTRSRLTNPGGSPILMEPVQGTVSLRLNAPPKNLVVYTLDAQGKRKGRAKAEFKEKEVTVYLDADDRTPWYEIVLR